MKDKPGAERTAWERVLLSRDKKRPRGHAYIEAMFEHFYELHGDRLFADDGAVLGGIGSFRGRPVTVISQEKDCNFGMCSPDGYRKALRLMRQAEKFGRPVICFVDTPGAACGIEAEERGQGEAIARSLAVMSELSVPLIAVVTGEGGSGGALALAMGNTVLMLENAIYSVLSPEGFASILWKDSTRSAEACDVMKLTAQNLEQLGVIDGIIPEPPEGAHANPAAVFDAVDAALQKALCQADRISDPAAHRHKKFRTMGSAFLQEPGKDLF